jgi:hypothetical protein
MARPDNELAFPQKTGASFITSRFKAQSLAPKAKADSLDLALAACAFAI